MPKFTSYDVIVIGAGPSGLSFARALAGTGLKICLIEKQPLAQLANPPLDGRDIALTHDSMNLMRDLAMWKHIPAHEISPIRAAKVFSGASSYFLGFDTNGIGKSELGCLVPNNEIRRAAYRAVKAFRNITIRAACEVRTVSSDEARATVILTNGETLSAPVVAAADSRFSATREQMGIAVAMKNFGRSAIVCRMTHEHAHAETAYECFYDNWTLAILPLQSSQAGGHKSSIVLTLPTDQTDMMMHSAPVDFNAHIERHLGDRLGIMRLTGIRHAYPLIGVYASRFAAKRFVLLGDAAVGMHPVTAHGYNLGLGGALMLAQEMRHALSLGIDIGDPTVLDAYARRQRRASAFLYYGTNAMVGVYTDKRPAATALRALGLRLANHIPPFKNYVTRQLTGKAA